MWLVKRSTASGQRTQTLGDRTFEVERAEVDRRQSLGSGVAYDGPHDVSASDDVRPFCELRTPICY